MIPWFMHSHGGVNTLVGVYPTPRGVFVRSWKDGVCEVTFYPMQPATRVVIPVIVSTDEDEIDAAVLAMECKLTAK